MFVPRSSLTCQNTASCGACGFPSTGQRRCSVSHLLLYYLQPSLGIIATLMLLSAFALVVVAFYLDRTRMKPLRNEWARRYGMTEMQMRDNLRAIRKGERGMVE